MSIPGVSNDTLRSVLSENLTPSDTIKTPERLFGRQKNLTAIDRALSSPGRQIFIYGDRGIGKTSLALTAAFLHSSAASPPIYILCGKTSTFAEVMQAIGNASIPIKERIEKATAGGGMQLSFLGAGAGYSRGTNTPPVIQPPSSLNDAFDIVRYAVERRGGNTVVVIDEMERVESSSERERFAEFIKNLPELGEGVRFIFCGIAQDLTEVLQSHPSAGRILENIKLERLNHSDLWRILSAPAEKLGVEIQRETLRRVGQISDGFPHYVHLIGESLFWSMFDDLNPIKKSGTDH